MANEFTVPLLPCRSIDEIVEFYTMLGFTKAYYQVRPNPYVSLKREDLQLDFFGIPGFKAENSYGTCLVIVPDTGELFEAFAAGMREVHGKLLVSGIPRMTRPRKRKNADNHSGFTVIDPGGNWIRIMAAKSTPEETSASGRLATTLQRAVVMGDSHGKHVRAAQILDAALERDKGTATAAELLEALAYRAELALRADDTAAAGDALTRARALILSETEHGQLAGTLAGLEDLEAVLRPSRRP
ncbi:VOC family protein [Streptomyces sp. ISL-10]|uniref:VOC family protein n=1 Tax=Streptomyces sp. ISL-10 TaxID=2819172 RepID=UPI001BE6BF5E|nr:VOC family protein [Streptomyces sp. ISL-10]MBT2367323.1 VOC family protein [Streptomyces sp. ISL-10]